MGSDIVQDESLAQGTGTQPSPTGTQAPAEPQFYQSGGSSQSSSSVSMDVLLPPILEFLGEARARREAEASRRLNAVTLLSQLVGRSAPAGVSTFPGFEKGGIADILGGIISGKGVAGFGPTIDALRQPGKTTIPISSLMAPEPTIGEEFGQLAPFAQQLINMAKTIQTGASQSSGGSFSTSQVQEPSASGGIDPLTMAVLAGLMGQMQGAGGTTPGQTPPAFGFDPATGDLIVPEYDTGGN